MIEKLGLYIGPLMNLKSSGWAWAFVLIAFAFLRRQQIILPDNWQFEFRLTFGT
jgi:hypothetical protein